MKPKTMVLLLVAIMCGLGAAYLTATIRGTTAPPPDLDYFWVPKKDIKAGHKVLKVEDEFNRVGFPKDPIAQKDWVADQKELKDVVVGKDLPANLPVTKAALSSNEPTLALLPKGFRAVSIGCSAVAGAAGFILPGNRVDVVCTLPGSKGKLTRIFLSDVLVLAVNEVADRPADKVTIQPGVVTFALTPADAERVTWVSSGGQITLLLRRPDDNGVVKTPGATSPWETKEGTPGGDNTKTDPAVAIVYVKVPLAKKDVETGIEIDSANFDSYFDEVEIPAAIAVKAMTKDQLLAAKDRHFYNKLLAGNWPTDRNLTSDVVAKPFKTHTMIGRSGNNPPVPYTYNLDTKTLITFSPAGSDPAAPAPAPAPAPKPGEGN
jgi:Flp pilus assembly protein CpaB